MLYRKTVAPMRCACGRLGVLVGRVGGAAPEQQNTGKRHGVEGEGFSHEGRSCNACQLQCVLVSRGECRPGVLCLAPLDDIQS